MKPYLIIETRDPVERGDVEWTSLLACQLKKKRTDVAIFLAENGVFAARNGAEAPGLAQLMKKGVRIYADRFALAERGIFGGDIVKGVEPAEIDLVAQQLGAGVKVMWL